MTHRKKYRLQLPSGMLALGDRTLIMGVLNVTTDSFFDGGKFLHVEKAAEHAFELERAGADILDIGGESTRPGSTGVSADQEMDRVLPLLEKLRGGLEIPISIDTQKARVAQAAVHAGAVILNDISALRSDPGMAEVARRHRLPIILMHMRGTPRTMQHGPFARDVVQDVRRGLRQATARAQHLGISRSQIILDPGIGFGKSFEQNFELLAHLPQFGRLGYPLLVGPSRKAFIGDALGGVPPEQRLWGTAATVTASVLGGAHIVRVHDVREMAQLASIADALLAAQDGRRAS
jgi:dihydropteroate synthase